MKDFETEFIAIITAVGRMFLPKKSYRFTIDNHMLISEVGQDYPEMITAEISSETLQKFLNKEIDLPNFWKKIRFFRKLIGIGSIKTQTLDSLPLMI